jgi:O-antigen/teichoic acid export membrane protein
MKHNFGFFLFRTGSIGIHFVVLWFIGNHVESNVAASILLGFNFCLMAAELSRFGTDNVVLRDYGKSKTNEDQFGDAIYERSLFELVLWSSLFCTVLATAGVSLFSHLLPGYTIASINPLQLLAIPLISITISRSFIYYAKAKSFHAVLWGQYAAQICLAGNVIATLVGGVQLGTAVFTLTGLLFFSAWAVRLYSNTMDAAQIQAKVACRKQLFQSAKIFFLTLCFVTIVGWSPLVMSSIVLRPQEYTELVILIRLAAAVLIPGGIFAPKISPLIAKLWSTHNIGELKRQYRKLQIYYFASAVIMALLVYLIAPQIVGKDIAGTPLHSALLVLLATHLISSAFGPNFTTLIMCNQEKIILNSSIAGAGAMIIQIFIFGHLFGALGVALSVATVIILQNIYHYTNIRNNVFNLGQT